MITVTLGAGGPFANGELVRLSADKTAVKAAGNSAAGYTGFLGALQTSAPVASGGKTNVVSDGLGVVKLEPGLAPTFGRVVYPSATAGLGALTPGAAGAPPVAVVFDASAYTTTQTVVAVLIPVVSAVVPSVAAWDRAKVRYYFVDNESGNDTNVGYIDDVPGADFTNRQAEIAAVAVKTDQRLREGLIPRVGGGRSAVILYKVRSDGGNYVNASGANDYIDIGYVGYTNFIQRASLDFTNTAIDKTDFGGVVDPVSVGPNADGSWTVASVANTYDITVAAGTLPVASAICGLHVQWKGNITPANRTIGNVVSDRLSDTVFRIGDEHVVAAGDEFFLRRPGVKFTHFVGRSLGNGAPSAADGGGAVFGGFEFTNAASSQVTMVGKIAPIFLRFAGSILIDVVGGPLGVSKYWLGENGEFNRTCTGIHFTSSAIVDGCGGALGHLAYSAFHGSLSVLNSTYLSLGTGSYLAGNVTLSALNAGVKAGFFGAYINFGSSHTYDGPARVKGIVTIQGCRMQIARADFQAATAGLVVQGEDNYVTLFNTIGTPTGNAIDLSGARNSTVDLVSGVTMTGNIVMAGGLTTTIAALATDEFIDASKNHVIGGAGAALRRVAAGSFFDVPAGPLQAGAPPPNFVRLGFDPVTKQFQIRESSGTTHFYSPDP